MTDTEKRISVPRLSERKETERNYGIDLLKIVSMLFVTVLHVLGQGGILEHAVGIRFDIGWFLEAAAFCAVNCFALASGYVSEGREFRPASVPERWLQVLFYTLGLFVLIGVTHPAECTLTNFWNAIFPITNKYYWYMTAYFCVLLLKPVLNAAVSSMDLKAAGLFFAVLFLFFSCIPCVFNLSLYELNGGHSALWLVLLYVSGGLIHKFRIAEAVPKRVSLAVYVLSLLIAFVPKCFGCELFYKDLSPAVLLESVGLLLFFARVRVSGTAMRRVISTVSGLTLGVYLLHLNPIIWQYVIKNRFIIILNLPLALFVPAVFGCALLIFLAGVLADAVRAFLFKKLRIGIVCTFVTDTAASALKKGFAFIRNRLPGA